MKPRTAIAMVWYRQDTYQELLTLFADADVLPPTFDEWLAKAENGRKIQEQQGHRVIPVEIDPETFRAWCAANRREMNASARNDFASAAAARILREEML